MNQPSLYIVATPIGNLSDITLRAIDTLKIVDLIAAEDTRHSRILLDHYQITTPLTSLHGDNEQIKSKKIIQCLEKGQSVALISDAGTPLISDPGESLVAEIVAAGFRVVPIPGACAAIAALSVSGLSTKHFYFNGFLPHKGKARREQLVALTQQIATLVFYESRHRIVDFLNIACEVFGPDRQAVVGRELTKQFESIYRGNLDTLKNTVTADSDQLRGEYVVLIAGGEKAAETDHFTTQQIVSVLTQHLSTKQAAKLTAAITGVSQRELYQQIINTKGED